MKPKADVPTGETPVEKVERKEETFFAAIVLQTLYDKGGKVVSTRRDYPCRDHHDTIAEALACADDQAPLIRLIRLVEYGPDSDSVKQGYRLDIVQRILRVTIVEELLEEIPIE